MSLALKIDHDKAMLKLNLAGIAIRKREATILLNEAKKLDKHAMLANQVKMMKEL